MIQSIFITNRKRGHIPFSSFLEYIHVTLNIPSTKTKFTFLHDHIYIYKLRLCTSMYSFI